MKRRFTIAIFALVLLSSFFIPFSVSAATIPSPDTGPFITSWNVYENVNVLGDVLVLVEYNIPYGTLPNDTAAVNFLVRLLDSSGAVLGTTTPFSYQDLGYGYGAVAIYFAPGAITWGAADTVQLTGNPGVSWTTGVPSVTQPMMATNWNASTTVIVGRVQICQQVIAIAIDLENRWNVSLTSSSVNGSVLNSYGQQYFGNVIPYFSTVCSNILTYTASQAAQPPPIAGIAASGTVGVVTGSPVTLHPGTNTVAISTLGDFTITLPTEYSGTATSGTATLVGGSATLGAATTTLATSSVGTIIIDYSAFSLTYQQQLQAIWPNATTTIVGGDGVVTTVGPGVSIKQAASSMGMTNDQYLFMTFLIVITIVMMVAAAAMGGPQFIPLLLIPLVDGCTKIGVIPMSLTIGATAVLFIISMFFLIHRRAAV